MGGCARVYICNFKMISTELLQLFNYDYIFCRSPLYGLVDMISQHVSVWILFSFPDSCRKLPYLVRMCYIYVCVCMCSYEIQLRLHVYPYYKII